MSKLLWCFKVCDVILSDIVLETMGMGSKRLQWSYYIQSGYMENQADEANVVDQKKIFI